MGDAERHGVSALREARHELAFAREMLSTFSPRRFVDISQSPAHRAFKPSDEHDDVLSCLSSSYTEEVLTSSCSTHMKVRWAPALLDCASKPHAEPPTTAPLVPVPVMSASPPVVPRQQTVGGHDDVQEATDAEWPFWAWRDALAENANAQRIWASAEASRHQHELREVCKRAAPAVDTCLTPEIEAARTRHRERAVADWHERASECERHQRAISATRRAATPRVATHWFGTERASVKLVEAAAVLRARATNTRHAASAASARHAAGCNRYHSTSGMAIDARAALVDHVLIAHAPIAHAPIAHALVEPRAQQQHAQQQHASAPQSQSDDVDSAADCVDSPLRCGGYRWGGYRWSTPPLSPFPLASPARDGVTAHAPPHHQTDTADGAWVEGPTRLLTAPGRLIERGGREGCRYASLSIMPPSEVAGTPRGDRAVIASSSIVRTSPPSAMYW